MPALVSIKKVRLENLPAAGEWKGALSVRVKFRAGAAAAQTVPRLINPDGSVEWLETLEVVVYDTHVPLVAVVSKENSSGGWSLLPGGRFEGAFVTELTNDWYGASKPTNPTFYAQLSVVMEHGQQLDNKVPPYRGMDNSERWHQGANILDSPVSKGFVRRVDDNDISDKRSHASTTAPSSIFVPSSIGEPSGETSLGCLVQEPMMFSCFAPPIVTPGKPFYLRVWAYVRQARDTVFRATFGGADDDGKSGSTYITNGKRVTVELFFPEHAFKVLPLNANVPASAHRPSVSDFVWTGEASSADFRVGCTRGIAPGRVKCEALVVQGTTVKRLSFGIEVVESSFVPRALGSGRNGEVELDTVVEDVGGDVAEVPFEELEFVADLGRGIQGFSSHYRWLGKDVVVKSLISYPAFDSSTAPTRSSLEHEANVLTLLGRHPNIVECYGLCRQSGIWGDEGMHIVTKLEEGGSIEDALGLRKKKRGPKHGSEFTGDMRVGWARDAARGLANSHAAGVLHNDVASRNVLLSHRGQGGYALLCDFGVGRFLQGGGAEKAFLIDIEDDQWKWPVRQMPRESLTHPYPLTYASDSWMFGMFLYEVFEGKQPWAGLDQLQVRTLVLEGKSPPKVPEMLKDRGSHLVKLYEACLSADSEKRPSMEHVVDVLSTTRPKRTMLSDRAGALLGNSPIVHEPRVALPTTSATSYPEMRQQQVLRSASTPQPAGVAVPGLCPGVVASPPRLSSSCQATLMVRHSSPPLRSTTLSASFFSPAVANDVNDVEVENSNQDEAVELGRVNDTVGGHGEVVLRSDDDDDDDNDDDDNDDDDDFDDEDSHNSCYGFVTFHEHRSTSSSRSSSSSSSSSSSGGGGSSSSDVRKDIDGSDGVDPNIEWMSLAWYIEYRRQDSESQGTTASLSSQSTSISANTPLHGDSDYSFMPSVALQGGRRPSKDAVIFSCFIPPAVSPGTSFGLRMLAYLRWRRDFVVREAMSQGAVEAAIPGGMKIAKWKRVTVDLLLPESMFEVLPLNPTASTSSARPSVSDFVWGGGPSSTEFRVGCKAGVAPGRVKCQALFVEGSRVTRLPFWIEVLQTERLVEAEDQPKTLHGSRNAEHELGGPLQEVTLARSLGLGPTTYTSTIHGVELELQAGSLATEIPLPVKITPSLKFVECRTGSGRAPFHGDAPTEEFLAMTFVHGPEEAIFQDEKPAKLRFFMGYADEFSREYDAEQVVEDEEIERYILESYRPLTSPDGEHEWTVMEPYTVEFRLVQGEREVWAETTLNHFSKKANGIKIPGYDDCRHGAKLYYYGDMGGSLTRRLKGKSSVPKVRFGNATQEIATFTSWPIFEHTDVAEEKESSAEIGAEVLATVGGGMRRQSSASGVSLDAARAPVTVLVPAGSYDDTEPPCDLRAHLQMHVKVGSIRKMEAGTNGEGCLQLFDVRRMSGNRMLVLRQPRLEITSMYPEIDWPCSSEKICALECL